MKKNKIIGSILSICLLLLLAGFSYAFFTYNKTGLYTHTITGGKMAIIYNETTGNNITIDNAYPLTDVEALTKGLEFEFTITGYNESDKNIYYGIEMDYGEDLSDKERFKDTDLKLSLFENDEVIFKNEIFANLDNQNIHYGYINQGTSSETPVTNNYKLRIWINDYVVISDTLSSDLSTWTDFEWDWLMDYNKSVYNELMNSDSQDLSDFGISIYTSEEFQKMYANFKVNVTANLTYGDMGYITYDANGGDYTPVATPLLTKRITTAKPVMQNKGFEGWSSSSDGVVEYGAGDYYSGNEQTLYAVYGDNMNKMIEYWPSDLQEIKAYISNVYFISEIQPVIDNKYNTAEYKWDLSYDESSDVKGWIEFDDNNEIISLYIASNGTTYFTNCAELFADWSNLKYISFDNADTSLVDDMSYMFNNSYSILNLKLQSFNTINVTNMSNMFSGCLNLQKVDVSSFDTSNVTNMSYMFAMEYRNYSYLSYLDLNHFDTSKVTNMSNMFYSCNGLSNLFIDNFDTSNVENMSSMFYSCNLMNNIVFENFDTSKVTDMSYMFRSFYANDIMSLDSWNTDNVTNMSGMFQYCGANIIKFSNKNLQKVEYMSNMFGNCSAEYLYLEECKMNYENTNVYNFFGSESYLIEISFRGSQNVIDVINNNSLSSTKTGYKNLKFVDYSECDFGERTLSPNIQKVTLEKIDFSDSIFNKVTGFTKMFYQSTIEIIDFSNVKLPSATNMTSMFAYCDGIKKIDLSGIDASQVTNMEEMFMGCNLLTEINFKNFIVKNLEYARGMFSDCSSL